MNIEDLRRRIIADPRVSDPAYEEAIATNPGLLALRAQLQSNNVKLAAGFADIASPPGLADRIILRARYRQRSRWMLAAAATVVLAVSASIVLRPETPPPIAVAMFDHAVTELGELNDAGDIKSPVVHASLQKIGVRFHDLGYRVRHLAECVVDGRTGRHLVIDTPKGLVTLLIFPQRPSEMRGSVELQKANFRGVIAPADKVAVGMIADRNMSRADIETLMHLFLPQGEA